MEASHRLSTDGSWHMSSWVALRGKPNRQGGGQASGASAGLASRLVAGAWVCSRQARARSAHPKMMAHTL